MPLPVGTTLGDYRIDAFVSRGGMGEIYRATDQRLGRSVALKLVAPELADRASIRDRFLAESRLVASLDDPHIVPIYEAGETDGRLFLAMRFVEDGDLGTLVERDGPLDPARALALLGGVARALDAAHARGLIHRDVKPSNILVARTASGGEHAYLADFGLVKRLDTPSAGYSLTGQIVGSVDYAAPEQIEGRPVDGAADTYSLGCVLYFCLAGRPPFPRDADIATLWAHVNDAPPGIAEVRPELAALDPVLARGMAKDPGARPAASSELIADATGALVETAPAIAAPMTAAAPLVKRRLPLAMAAIAIPIVAVVAIVAANGTGSPGATAAPRSDPPVGRASPNESGGPPSPSPSASQDPVVITVGTEGEGTPLEEGQTYRFDTFRPATQFEIPEPGWRAVAEYVDGWSIILQDDPNQEGIDGGIDAGLVQVVYDTPCLEAARTAIPDGVFELIDWLSANNALTVSDPYPTTLGGYSGVYVDISSKGTPDCPMPPDMEPEVWDRMKDRTYLFPIADNFFWIKPEDRLRIYVMDVEGTPVSIMASTIDAGAFDGFIERARPILDSISFDS